MISEGKLLPWSVKLHTLCFLKQSGQQSRETSNKKSSLMVNSCYYYHLFIAFIYPRSIFKTKSTYLSAFEFKQSLMPPSMQNTTLKMTFGIRETHFCAISGSLMIKIWNIQWCANEAAFVCDAVASSQKLKAISRSWLHFQVLHMSSTAFTRGARGPWLAPEVTETDQFYFYYYQRTATTTSNQFSLAKKLSDRVGMP